MMGNAGNMRRPPGGRPEEKQSDWDGSALWNLTFVSRSTYKAEGSRYMTKVMCGVETGFSKRDGKVLGRKL